jgi:hypothetical protein
MKPSICLGLCLIGASALLACRAPQPPTTPPSPTRDHSPPSTDPGDGDIIGADRVPPAQKLEESPKVTDQGPKPAEQPPTD